MGAYTEITCNLLLSILTVVLHIRSESFIKFGFRAFLTAIPTQW